MSGSERTLSFYGHSDDLLEIDGTIKGEPNEVGCYDDTAAVSIRTEDEGLIITATYAPRATDVGCWSLGVSPLDELVAIPAWPITWKLADNGYSAVLTLMAPLGARVAQQKTTDALPSDRPTE